MQPAAPRIVSWQTLVPSQASRFCQQSMTPASTHSQTSVKLALHSPSEDVIPHSPKG